jgi:ATP-dependent Clp protease ATP-binding subunit ClpX
MTSKKKLNCSFCGKTQDQVIKLIAGPDVFICDECIKLCTEIVAAEDPAKVSFDGTIPSPRKIKEFLDQYIIGQEDAKRVMAVAVYNHYQRLANPTVDEVELEKSNILLLGPTGSGKTLIAQTIAKLLDVPFAIADATSLTEAGYVGDDVETIITRLVQNADGDISKAERGIIYLDEVDKKAKRGEGVSITRDVSGEGVQQALLKIIEGSDVRVSPSGGRKHPQSEIMPVNTRNILFIVGGAFVGLDDIVSKRLDSANVSIGFGGKLKDTKKSRETVNDLLSQVDTEDLVKFGLIPELVGRLPVVTALQELNEQQLIQVLTEPKNALVKQFVKRFKIEGVELEFTEKALHMIAHNAVERRTGARGLRAVIERKLIPLQFQLPDLVVDGLVKVIITEEVILGIGEPRFTYDTKKAK